MATAAALEIDFTANTATLSSDLGKATRALSSETAKMNKALRAVERQAKGVERAFGGLKAGMAALAGALAVRQFSQFAKSALDSSGALEDTAAKVGLTTAALQQLRFAAKLTGVQQNALDMGMQRFSRRLGEVAQGTGSLRETAKQYNVSLTDSVGRMRANIDVLKDFADVIQNAASDQERLRIAFKLFDSEGSALVNTLRDGRVGLERYMQQAIDFGAVMDKEVIAKGALAGDALDVLGSVFQTTFDTAIIQAFADSMTLSRSELEAAKSAGENFGHVVGTAMRGIVEAAKFVSRNLREIGVGIAILAAMKPAALFLGASVAVFKFATALVAAARAGALVQAVIGKSVLGAVAKLALVLGAGAAAWSLLGDEAEAAITQTEAAIESAAGGGVIESEAIDKAIKQLRLEVAQREQLLNALGRSEAEHAAVAAAIDIETEATKLSIDVGTRQGRTWVDLARQAQALGTSLEKLQLFKTIESDVQDNVLLIDALRKSNEEYEKQAARLQVIAQFRALNGKLTDEERQKLEALADTMGKQKADIDKMKQANDDWRKAQADVFNVVGKAFEDAVIQGEQLRDILAALLQDIQRVVMRVTVTKPLDNYLTGLVGGDKSGGNFLTGIGTWFDGFFAEGGRPAPGKVSVVGENGPEFFVPDTAGTILPNGAGMGGGASYYIDARGADRSGLARLEQTIRDLNGSIERRAVNAVVGARARNPGLFAAS